MTKERIFYIAYKVCDYIRSREMQNQFEDYEFCMYVSELASEIEDAISTSDYNGLKQYYKALYDESTNLVNVEEYVVEIDKLIGLLDECRNCLV